MRHGRRKVPTWLFAIALASAIAVHAVLFLRLGTYVTMAGALGVTALVLVAKHLGLARWSHRKSVLTEQSEGVPKLLRQPQADDAQAARVR
jgi:hypothetical protein